MARVPETGGLADKQARKRRAYSRHGHGAGTPRGDAVTTARYQTSTPGADKTDGQKERRQAEMRSD